MRRRVRERNLIAHCPDRPTGLSQIIQSGYSAESFGYTRILRRAGADPVAGFDDELRDMCCGLACRVKPGGRFVSITTTPDLYAFEHVPDYTVWIPDSVGRESV